MLQYLFSDNPINRTTSREQKRQSLFEVRVKIAHLPGNSANPCQPTYTVAVSGEEVEKARRQSADNWAKMGKCDLIVVLRRRAW
jgi:hypothetical protein